MGNKLFNSKTLQKLKNYDNFQQIIKKLKTVKRNTRKASRILEIHYI